MSEPSRRTVLIAAGAASTGLWAAAAPGAAAAEPPRPAGPGAADNPVVRENRAEGSGRWAVGAGESRGVDLRAPQIQAYASAASVTPDESLTLNVSGRTAATCAIEIHRFGHYGGARSRLLHTAADVPVGRGWKLTVPHTWVSGLHLAVLTSADGYRAFTPFVVREPARRSDVLAVVPLSYAGRRPYPGLGLPEDFGADTSACQWLEEAGYDVTYATEEDVRARRVDPRRYPAVLHPSAVALPSPLALSEPGRTDPKVRHQAAALLDGLIGRHR
ncbi:N,N-dimethylformamidase beta subunit family domain-containing protein [Streptomyces sp. NPDC053493]|uniref:N,N-dimethylformamidase beta subunit family domain-containing protein n=1 Tax=Streptomyces sp. NPDC053493 TaxID=3365705 RepID=UPI0037CDD02E